MRIGVASAAIVALGLLAFGRPSRASDLPSISIVSPENYTYFKEKKPDPLAPNAADNPDFPLMNVTVQFTVANWEYPAAGHGVGFVLDDGAASWLAVTTTAGGDVPLVLSGVGPGQHTLWACLVRAEGAGGWTADLDPVAAGWQRACASVILRVSIVDCWPTVYDAASHKYVCDPAHADACCNDTNPCSVDNCVDTSWPADGTHHFECRYGYVASDCCQSDLECAPSEHCYGIDNPITDLDDALVNRCYGCDFLSATADQSCDDQDECTVDSCLSTYQCLHQPIVNATGTRCCVGDADCDDDDPCSIDRCEQIVNGKGWCGFHPYTDLTDAEILAYGHDPASFEGCCTPGKELTYCTDHLVIVDDQVVQDACWNVACIANQCRYGKDPDPLCCNTGFECDDCAEATPDSGECVKKNPDLLT